MLGFMGITHKNYVPKSSLHILSAIAFIIWKSWTIIIKCYLQLTSITLALSTEYISEHGKVSRMNGYHFDFLSLGKIDKFSEICFFEWTCNTSL